MTGAVKKLGFVSGTVRTGIDVGTVSVKLVRGVGSPNLNRITHLGVEDWDPEGPKDDVERASRALWRLMGRLGLSKSRLGHLAVAVGGEDASLREVVLPPLSDRELQQALPYESKKHLDLEGMDAPVVSAQILGPAPPETEGEPEQTRVLFAAVPRAQRDFPLKVLGRLGLDPEVVDLEPLAGLNAVLANPSLPETPTDGAMGLLDLGGRYGALQITGPQGGVMSRTVAPGLPRGEETAALNTYLENLAPRITETLTFYRGRYRQEVNSLFLSGGGAMISGFPDSLRRMIEGRSVSILDPLAGLTESAIGFERVSDHAARFATACGLCRWWDSPGV